MSEPKNSATVKKENGLSNLLLVGGWAAAGLGVAELGNYSYLIYMTVKQYAAQGVKAGVVLANLIPSSFLPKLFDILAIYGGISLILFGVRAAYKKLCRLTATLPEEKVSTVIDEESAMYQPPLAEEEETPVETAGDENTGEPTDTTEDYK